MLFNSYGFVLVFLPVVFAGFLILGRAAPAWVVPGLGVASLFFYTWWDWRFTPLLLA